MSIALTSLRGKQGKQEGSWVNNKNGFFLFAIGMAAALTACSKMSTMNMTTASSNQAAGTTSPNTTPVPPAPPPPTTIPLGTLQMAANPIGDLQALTLINTDLNAQPSASRPNLRYFTLEQFGNLGSYPSVVPVDVERSALIKMINFTSMAPTIVQPVPIDAGHYIYRVDMSALKWTATAWTNLKANDPYFVPADFPTNLQKAATQTMRADWWVSMIPFSGNDDYFSFLFGNIGGNLATDTTIENANGVNRWGDYTAGYPSVVRAGVEVSGTEAFNRVLEWHASDKFGTGSVGSGDHFRSFNEPSDLGLNNIYSHPYKPIEGNPNPPATPNPYDFSYAGGDSDNFTTLPNGLWAYYTTESVAPFIGAVQTTANAGEAFIGPSRCFQCHDPVTGLIPFVDKVNAAIMASPFGAFPADLQTTLLQMYNQNAFNAIVAKAGTAFAASYKELNLPASESVGVNNESTNRVYYFYGTVLNIFQASSEVGVTPMQLIGVIKANTTLALDLSALITLDSNGNANGVVRRDLWESDYAKIRQALYPTLPVPQ